MGILRQMFLADPGLAERVRARLDRQATAGDDPAVPLMQALVALYAGARDRYLNFYGPPGTITTVPYASLVSRGRRRGSSGSG